MHPAPELSIVVPTFNERANIPILVERLSRLLVACDWEVVFVDDNSPDGTAAAARAIGETDGRVRCIRRIGRRGLAGACLEGMLSSQARYVAVMDADLQHDESLLVGMLDCLRSGGADLAVASRYLYGGSAAGLSKQRSRVSRWSNALVRHLLGIDLTDPMSGHFMIRRDVFETLAPGLSSQGFKILLDILATGRGRVRTIELPSTFRERQHGESKLELEDRARFRGAGDGEAHQGCDFRTLHFVLSCRADRHCGAPDPVEYLARRRAVVRRGAGACDRRRNRLEFRAQ